jgi:integrase
MLSVRRVIFRRRKGDDYDFTELKTNRSRRIIPISKSFIIELKNHRRKQSEEKLKFSFAHQNLDLVFASEKRKASLVLGLYHYTITGLKLCKPVIACFSGSFCDRITLFSEIDKPTQL